MSLVNIKGVEINFPYKPYDCQVKYMEKVIQCLQEVCTLNLYSWCLKGRIKYTFLQKMTSFTKPPSYQIV
jgi:hypothetical protein